MLNMSNIMSNRNSTPETASVSSLRPPSSRLVGTGHPLRASADMAAVSGQPAPRLIRPSSDIYGQTQHGAGGNTGELDPQDKLAREWIADIDQYENVLEEMAAASLDQEFKDELSAIEQWFQVLSEPERTAALYRLLQQATQIQVKFFKSVLGQMDSNQPLNGVLSPANLDKDAMSNRLSDAMSMLSMDSAKNFAARPNSGVYPKRQSGLPSEAIKSMFPDAAAAIAIEKAKYTERHGAMPCNRNSASVEDRNSLATPKISAPADDGRPLSSPWGASDPSRPKSSSGQTPMGHFVQPPLSAGLRSPGVQLTSNSNIQSTTLTTGDKMADLNVFSPYGQPSGGNWASMVNTPIMTNFNHNPGGAHSDLLANATAMKLSAMATVNNRVILDNPRKFHKARQDNGQTLGQNPASPALPGMQVMDSNGKYLQPRDQLLSFGQSQLASFQQRSRPNSPGFAVQNYTPGLQAFTSTQNGFLSAFDIQPGLVGGGLVQSMGAIGLGGHEGYLSDHSDMNRGRSPRGRRGSSKPPEDPTDPCLLQDIPAWLRSLRLHKYTDNLKDLKWMELIELDDEKLGARGVQAVGARRKMLKAFDQVKEAKAAGKLTG